MSPHAQSDAALLLRSVDYAEADRILTLLTERAGKLSVIAKGARKSKRRFAGALEPFALLQVEIVPAKHGLARLEAARIERAFPKLLSDLARMNAAGAGLSLLRELLPEALPDPEVFADTLLCLQLLDAGELPAAALRVSFELTQLARAGFSPRLSACGVCGRPAEPGRAGDFDPRRGFLVCQACGGAPFRLRGSARESWQAASDGELQRAAAGLSELEDLETSARALELFIAHRLERAPS